jgi:hypothetical protein
MIPLRQREVWRYLGYRNGAQPEGEMLTKLALCEEQLQRAVTPRSVCRRFPLLHTGADRVRLAGIDIASRALSRHLAGCDEVFLLAATLGLGPDRLIRRASVDKMSDAVIYQAMSAEMIESYCDSVNDQLLRRVRREGKYLKPRFSPGYGDLSLEVQPRLAALLDAAKQIGLTLTDSLLMVPSKSVTAIIGITSEPQRDHLRGCSLCGKRDCAFRREG